MKIQVKRPNFSPLVTLKVLTSINFSSTVAVTTRPTPPYDYLIEKRSQVINKFLIKMIKSVFKKWSIIFKYNVIKPNT